MKKTAILLTTVFLLLATAVSAEPVKITVDGEAYGHHGACMGWNDCGTAQQCALLACKANGFDTLVSYGEDKPCTGFDMCHLFRSNNDQILDCGWGNGCEVRGVTDIYCEDGEFDYACDYNPNPGNEVPEFGVIAGLAILIGAGIVIYTKRR